jgi:hypothetical protein
MVKEGDIFFFFHRPKEIAEEVTLNGWGWYINRKRLLVQVLDSEDVDDFSRQI